MFISLKKFYFNHKGKTYFILAHSLYNAITAVEKRFGVIRRQLQQDPFYTSVINAAYDYSEIEEV
jgi:hypothetical protein